MPRKTKRKTKRKEMEEATEREGEAMRGEEAKAPGALTFVVECVETFYKCCACNPRGKHFKRIHERSVMEHSGSVGHLKAVLRMLLNLDLEERRLVMETWDEFMPYIRSQFMMYMSRRQSLLNGFTAGDVISVRPCSEDDLMKGQPLERLVGESVHQNEKVERMMTHVEFGAAVINEGLKLAARKEKRRVKEIAMQACLKRAMENDDFNAEEAAVMAFKVMSCDEPNLAKYAAMPEKSMVAEHMGVFMGPGPEKGPGPQSSTEAEYVGEGV